jgi:ABC-type lipoprotein export system ATPase subunit
VRINIKNCNNIDSGNIEVKENTLNIKYAINGTGKSTIARAILTSISDRTNRSNGLQELTPFKNIGSGTGLPEVEGIENISNIKIFDEKYINEFVFQADELLKGSFDIFIRDENYDKGMQEINALVETMQKMLSQDKDIGDLIKDFNELSSSFGKPTKSGIHGSSNMAKAFKDGNKIVHIPAGLEGFKDYIQHSENYKWIKWQLDGKNYIDISSDCPYCTNDIKNNKDTIRKVSEVYEPKVIETLNKIIGVFHRLDKYFSDEAKLRINEFVKNIDGYTEDQINYLKEVKNQIELLNEKFLKAQNLGFTSLKEVDKVIEGLKSHKIDINLYVHLNSESTIEKVNIVNNAIEELLTKAGELQGSIAKQKRLIERLVKENSEEINAFLKNAGYKYKVTLIEDKDRSYRLKLIHNDINDEVSNVKNHLSFGERNAFSLVLFMYDALKNKPDLIVLDDPISSFDKTKKYAIIDMLFRKNKSFKDKTVLLLTHDFDPIVDMVYHHTDRFTKPFATFLENKHNILGEKEIQKSDIKTFFEINSENLKINLHEINKLVYLRRLYEITNTKKFGYDIISNIFHKRDIPILREYDEVRNIAIEREMTLDEINEGSEEIRKDIPEFDFVNLLNFVKSEADIKTLYSDTSTHYEKLHIYRIIFEDKADDIESDIIQKFINEAFHIENNYIYQLNPRDYPVVPQYVIDECDRFIETLN